MKHDLFVDALERALIEELGLVVTTNNPRQFAYHLHKITKGNPRYAELIITVPSLQETVIIAKRSVELYDTELEVDP